MTVLAWRAIYPLHSCDDARMSQAKLPRLLVTRAIFADVLERLRLHFDVSDNPDDQLWQGQALMDRLKGCDAMLTTPTERVDAALLSACPQLRMCANMAVGYNNIDLPACTARRVLVSNTPDVLTETTADFGMAMLLAAARRLPEGERFLRRGAWQQWRYDMLMGQDVHGSTLGVLGMGRIGQALARRAAHGFGMRVLYHNRTRLDAGVEQACNAEYVDKASLLRRADHLVLALPYSPGNHHVIGMDELRQMKPSASLVNIARGGVVDDAALARALKEGLIATAALDVFEDEPRVHPALLALENVVLTPHMASASETTRRAMAALAADNLITYFTTGRALTPLNPETYLPA